MARKKLKYLLAAMASLSLLPLAACGSNSTSDGSAATQDTASIAVPQTGNRPKMTALESAGEPFEALTEQAFTANPSQLMSLYKDAENAAIGVHDELSRQDAQTLDALLMKSKAAINAGKPTDIALSAVEGYKLIVSAFPPDSKIPVEVSLLDYAGFRVQADLKTSPARWEDAKTATDYAIGKWNAVQASVSDKPLRDKFGKALSTLDEAIAVKNQTSAAAAASHELDIVDELENYFKAS